MSATRAKPRELYISDNPLSVESLIESVIMRLAEVDTAALDAIGKQAESDDPGPWASIGQNRAPAQYRGFSVRQCRHE